MQKDVQGVAPACTALASLSGRPAPPPITSPTHRSPPGASSVSSPPHTVFFNMLSRQSANPQARARAGPQLGAGASRPSVQVSAQRFDRTCEASTSGSSCDWTVDRRRALLGLGVGIASSNLQPLPSQQQAMAAEASALKLNIPRAELAPGFSISRVRRLLHMQAEAHVRSAAGGFGGGPLAALHQQRPWPAQRRMCMRLFGRPWG